MDFLNIINSDHVRIYLSAEWGEKLGVYPNGKVVVGQDVGNEIDPDECPFVWIKCPGIGNLDLSDMAEDYAIWQDGCWLVEDTGEKIDDQELIRRACEEGDVSDDIENIIDLLEEDLLWQQQQ